MVNIIKKSGFLLLLFLLAGCGGSSGEGASSAIVTSATASKTFSGLFLGSTVTGMSYVITADGQSSSGTTDASGGFNYTLAVNEDGSPKGGSYGTATFAIGHVTLGSTILSGDAMRITAFDLVDENLADYRARVENIEKYICSFSSIPSQCQSVIISASEINSRNRVLGTMTLAELDNSTFIRKMADWGALDIASLDVSSHLDETKSGVDALRVRYVDMVLGSTSVIADGSSQVMVRLMVTDLNDKPLKGAQVRFQTTAGFFDRANPQRSKNKITDANGQALVMLVAPTHTAEATVTAAVGGRFQYDSVHFIAGPPDTSRSSITVNPATLVADGSSTAQVTVLLQDANGNPVADGTDVTLIASQGQIDASMVTQNGQAQFILTAPETSGIGQLSVFEYPELAAVTVPFGAASPTGKAAAITVFVDGKRLTVAGVGGDEKTSLAIQVLDAVGDAIDESASGYGATVNNLRVTLRSHPGGGEGLSGLARTTDASGVNDLEIVSDTDTILVRTLDGFANVNLTSGTLPGVVEIQVQALDSDGVTVLATAITSVITIASGTPHLITLTDAMNDSMIHMSEYGMAGVYCQMGSALVTDRYGNAVPDGTVISLGLIDSVIHEGVGDIAKNSSDLIQTSASDGFEDDFFTASIIRNGGIRRSIQIQDRIFIPNHALPGDRSRFVASIGGTVLGTDTEFLRENGDSDIQNGLRFYVGAALLGGAIHGYSGAAGCDPVQLTTGSATVIGGIASLRLTFPANRGTILNGCYGYNSDTGDYSNLDMRHANPRSAQVLVMAAANDSSATTVEKGRFCFSSIIPATLSVSPTSLSGNTTLSLKLEDANGIRLPFIPARCDFTAISNISGKFDVGISPGTENTDGNGLAVFNVSINGGGGGATPDVGTITCRTADTTATVAVSVP